MITKIIIDTDPGIDDAIAICMAIHAKDLNILGFTSVFGNTKGHITALNALRLASFCNEYVIPVAQGSLDPLVIPFNMPGTTVHGEDGMGNTSLPTPEGKLISQSAAEFIAHTIRQYPGEVTLLTLGPLTNIALALRINPDLPFQVKDIVIMGGAVANPGNVNAVAEANIYRDPHAAEMVFASGCPISLVGLDVTHKTIITPDMLERIYLTDNPAIALLKKIIPHYQGFFNEHYHMGGSFFTHDPSALAYVLDPDLFKTRSAPIFVTMEGRTCGQTIADWEHQWEKRKDVEICLEVNSKGVLNLVEKLLKNSY